MGSACVTRTVAGTVTTKTSHASASLTSLRTLGSVRCAKMPSLVATPAAGSETSMNRLLPVLEPCKILLCPAPSLESTCVTGVETRSCTTTTVTGNAKAAQNRSLAATSALRMARCVQTAKSGTLRTRLEHVIRAPRLIVAVTGATRVAVSTAFPTGQWLITGRLAGTIHSESHTTPSNSYITTTTLAKLLN